MIPPDPDQIVFGYRVLYRGEVWVVADKLGPPTNYVTLRREDEFGEPIFAKFVRIALVKPTQSPSTEDPQ